MLGPEAQRERELHKTSIDPEHRRNWEPRYGGRRVPQHENNSNSPWGYTHYKGMRWAMMITWRAPQAFSVAERLLLVTLYSALVKDTDIIDKRVTQQGLADRCGVSRSSVTRAFRKWKDWGLIEFLEGSLTEKPVIRIPVEELDEGVHDMLDHTDWPHKWG